MTGIPEGIFHSNQFSAGYLVAAILSITFALFPNRQKPFKCHKKHGNCLCLFCPLPLISFSSIKNQAEALSGNLIP